MQRESSGSAASHDAPGAERIAEIVESALERDASERAQFLNEVCGSNEVLRSEVESLLHFQGKARDFIETPAYETISRLLVNNDGEFQPGQALGQYKVVSLLGRGGMGEVYLAEDGELERCVAIKVVTRGTGYTTLVNRYSYKEERILAGLNHANIAGLYGTGATAAGLHYFIMEYVNGLRVDDYCRDKPLRTRLELFRKICAAVSYAHQNLIIHRDIKPANIRVTSDGEPKLLDFGIAKLLDSEPAVGDAQTMTVAAMMTPEYASPEQIRGENMSTATDVYSLGVVLYELLTGERPYRIKNRNATEIARAIVEQEPLRPSTAVARLTGVSKAENRHSKILKGDLDNIVMKALRKEPVRRYTSAAQFSDDIRRYLDGLPVTARKGTFNYRALKFIKRNKVVVTAAALILLSLIGGIVATALEARRVDRQRARAEQRFNDVRRLAHSLMFEIHDSVRDLQGSTQTRRLIVSRALEYLDSLAAEAAGDPALQRELATAYEKIGDIQGNPYSANLGDIDGALASYRKAVAIREKLKDADSNVDTRMEMGRSYRALGDILEQKGDVRGTMDNYRRSRSIFEHLSVENPADASVQDELARAYETLGDGLNRVADSTTERLQAYQTSLSIRQNLLGRDATNLKLRRSTGLILLKVGGADDAKKPGSVATIKRGIEMLEALSAEYPDNERALREVGYAYYQLGNTLVEAGDYSGALESRRKAFAIRQQISTRDPKNAQAAFDFAVAHADLAEVLTATGATVEALDEAGKALSILQRLSAADPTNAVYSRNIGLCYEKFGVALAREGADETKPAAERVKDWTEARAWFDKALSLFLDLGNRNQLMPSDSGQTAKFQGKIRECEEALARLKS